MSLCCISVAASWAEEYTDANGVTWSYDCYEDWNESISGYTYRAYINSVSEYDSVVVVPGTLPYGGMDATVCGVGTTFSYKSDITSVTLPSSITRIDYEAFRECYSLREVNIPKGVTYIDQYAFYYCQSLQNVIIPESVNSIGYYAFNYCRSLKNVTISEGVTYIEHYAFEYCNALDITLPASLEQVYDGAFNYCKTVRLKSTDPESLGNSVRSYQPFNGVQDIVVPDAAYNAYMASSTWSNYKSLLCMASEAIDYQHTDSNNVTWTYRYVTATNSVKVTFAEGYDKELVFPAALPYGNGSLPIKDIKPFLGHNQNLEFVDLSETQISEIPCGMAVGFFAGCSALREVILPSTLKVIDYAAFQSCHNLIKADIPNGVTTIGSQAFSGCNKLDVEIPASVTSIGDGAFYTYASEEMGSTADKVYKMLSTTPPARMENSFSSEALFVVPTASLSSYQTANVWSNYASNILPQNLAVVTVNVTAQPNGSGVLNAIGGAANQTKIVDLTVKGTINGYDFVMFKDKMTNLRYLDLSEADIVYNPYYYYEGQYYSQNDTLGAYAFHEEDKLISIKLPKSVKHIGYNAFYGCRSLKEIDFGKSLQGIDSYAFEYCNSLTNLVMPNTLKYIGYYAFYNCSSLSEIDLGRNLQRIESDAFRYCNNLRNIVLPDKLEYIGSCAFWNTGLKEVHFPASLERIENSAFYGSKLEVVRIPSSLRYIGDQAFKNCSNLKKVYTYTLEPTHINENTFSNFETAMLYVPTASGQNYYWDEGWKRFVNVDEFDGVFTYFYLNKDLVLDATTGSVDGIPEAELYSGSGLIVEDAVDLTLSDLKIYHDGSHGASIIAKSEEGNVHADSLHVHINVVPGRWYFFSFPFDLRKRDISLGNKHNQYVFRYYDGEERAKKGNGGWKNVAHTDNVFLKATQGYIFQCSHEDVLTISLKDVTFKRENKQNELTEHVASNLQDASWNFTGNPYLSYYDIKSVNYVAPITIWNGYSYEAITAMDDDYTFAPFEAFFVQKPTGVADIEFYGESQITGREAGNGNNNPEMGASPSRREVVSKATRSLVNITLSDGNVTDRTRVVFNEAATATYETTCDAAKFSTTGVPQLYTIDSRAAKYAINERPMAEGIVTLGYTAPAQGNYVLEAPRMDVSVVLKDNVTGAQHDFSEGAYEFASEAGTYEGRFTIMTKTGTTGIDEVETATQAECYNLKGQRVEEAQEQGVYIKNNRKVVKR